MNEEKPRYHKFSTDSEYDKNGNNNLTKKLHHPKNV